MSVESEVLHKTRTQRQHTRSGMILTSQNVGDLFQWPSRATLLFTCQFAVDGMIAKEHVRTKLAMLTFNRSDPM